MTETFFPVSDLARRKTQTSLIVISLMLCVASTLFLLLFMENIGFRLSMVIEGVLTTGFSSVFSSFITFVGFLTFIIGGSMMSFLAFTMMSQRVRDMGLMKAVGCPNSMVFGYFMVELVLVTSVGCILGIVLGIVANFASTSFLNSLGFQVLQKPMNVWTILLVFAVFFIIALFFGGKPVLDATKVSAGTAISPEYYLGLSKEQGSRVVSKRGFTLKLALRSLYRRKSVTIRLIVFLSTVMTLMTVSVAGGIIADYTTGSWVERAVGRNMVLIAHADMCSQYRLLLSKFHQPIEDSEFEYVDERYMVPENLLSSLMSIEEITCIDERLILEEPIREVPGYVFDPETASTRSVGNHHNGTSLIVGIVLGKESHNWFMEGGFSDRVGAWEAVIGDSIAHRMFSMPLNQNIRLMDSYFDVVGVCLDPINNGNVIYVSIDILQNITELSEPNVVMVKVDSSADFTETLTKIQERTAAADSEFMAFALDEVLESNLNFLNFIWHTIMLLPLFSVVSASLCMIGYVMLTIDEQHKELGVLRAVGAKPISIVKIVSLQSSVILFASCVLGISVGIMSTLMILIPEPLFTEYQVLEIAGWQMIAMFAVFIFSLYPAVRFSRKPILETIGRP